VEISPRSFAQEIADGLDPSIPIPSPTRQRERSVSKGPISLKEYGIALIIPDEKMSYRPNWRAASLKSILNQDLHHIIGFADFNFELLNTEIAACIILGLARTIAIKLLIMLHVSSRIIPASSAQPMVHGVIVFNGVLRLFPER